MDAPITRYASVGRSQVAYQVIGDGPIDLVYLAPISNIETRWDFPPLARWLERLAGFSRLITFDRRGMGASDPVRLDALPTWEHWVEDLTAVLDAAGSQQASILTEWEGGLWGMMFAATYPERTTALVIWNGWARLVQGEDYPLGFSWEFAEHMADLARTTWGQPEVASIVAPAFADDPQTVAAVAKYQRTCSTPAAYAEQITYQRGIDIRDVLPSIQAPTLVLHRKGWPIVPIEMGRYVADHVPGARFVEVPGTDGLMWGEGADTVLAEVEEFLTGRRSAIRQDRVLSTVLFTDIVGSTERASSLGDRHWNDVLDRHRSVSEVVIARYGGRISRWTGDGLLALFDLPGRALQCALELERALASGEIPIRAGVHTGEIEFDRDEQVRGIAVHIGTRIMAAAASGEILCSRTVRDLVTGAGFDLIDRGERELKGVPEPWQVFAVRRSAPIDPHAP